MKYLLPLLLLATLTGCAAQEQAPTDAPTEADSAYYFAVTEPTEPAGLYIPGSQTENRSGGTFKLFMPKNGDCREILPLGENKLLLVSGGSTATKLTLLTGEALVPAAVHEAPCVLSSADGSLYVSDDTIAYYAPMSNVFLFFNHDLMQTLVVSLPDDLTGSAYLSADGSQIYYTAGSGIKALDLSLGVARTLRKDETPLPGLTGSCLDGQVLSFQNGAGQTVYLSAADGSTLRTDDGTANFTTQGGEYLAETWEAGIRRLIWSDAGTFIWEFDPGSQNCAYLQLPGGALTMDPAAEGTAVTYHDLANAKRHHAEFTSKLEILDGARLGDTMYLLCLDTGTQKQRIYSWALGDGEEDSSLIPYYTAALPDSDALNRMQAQADGIGEKYGVNIQLWENAATGAPAGYSFEAEYLEDVYLRDLETVDAVLRKLPTEFYTALKNPLTIKLVRGITGNNTLCSLENMVLPYWDGASPCIAVTVGDHLTEGLLHGLGHMADSIMLSRSNEAYAWNDSNPWQFYYAFSYVNGVDDAWQVYLEGEHRHFVDGISTHYPKEDRAQFFAAALGGDASVFEADGMQDKLCMLCEALREALDLEEFPEILPWEQYLEESLLPDDN